MIDVVPHLRTHPVLAIMRGVPVERIVGLAWALHAGGIRSVEVAFTDGDAGAKIEALVRAYDDADAGSPVVVGAGTITTSERAEAARASGARFLVTPHVAPRVLAYGREYGLPVVCGASTPSEIAEARELGAAFIKLFPADPLGPAYLRALLGPYPDLEVFVVGGIGIENADAFLEAGAIGLGVGGALTSCDWTDPDFGAVTSLARALVKKVEAVAHAQR